MLKKKGYKTKYGSITEIPTGSNQFDNIFCSEVLEHIEDYKKAIKEISRTLKKGGFAFITIPSWMHYWNIDDEFVGHFRRFNPQEFQKDLELSGLKVVGRKNIGSKMERFFTLMSVKSFKSSGKVRNFMVYPYIIANHILSYLITASSFITSERNSNIILFICIFCSYFFFCKSTFSYGFWLT